MILWIVLYTIGFCFLIFCYYSSRFKRGFLPVLAKGLLSLGFIFIAFQASRLGGNQNLFLWLLPALILYFLGDVFLVLAGDSVPNTYFFLGFFSFLIGHVVFSSGLFRVVPFTLFDVFVPALGVCVGAVVVRGSGFHVGKMRPVLLVYMAVLTLFVTRNWLFAGMGEGFSLSNLKGLCFVCGATFFFISDIILLFELFYKKRWALTRFWNLLCYYYGMLGIALGFLF